MIKSAENENPDYGIDFDSKNVLTQYVLDGRRLKEPINGKIVSTCSQINA